MKKYILIIIFVLFLAPRIIFASSLSLSPSFKNLKVGDTFDVSVLLDTNGKSVNVMQVFLSFPKNLLQVVSYSNSSSVISIWITPFQFDNSLGTISSEGGMPHGIVTSNGVLSTIKFKVKSAGNADIKFLNTSRLLLNDGLATSDLLQTTGASFILKSLATDFIDTKLPTPNVSKIKTPTQIAIPPLFSQPIPPFTPTINLTPDPQIPQDTTQEVVPINNINNVFFISVVKFFQEKWSAFKDFMINSGNFIWFIVALLLLILSFAAYKALTWHKKVETKLVENILPQDTVNKLIELKDYRERYGPKMFIFLPTMNFLNFQNVYNLIIIILMLVVLGLVVFIFFHVYHGRRKHLEFKKSLRDIEKAMHIEFNLLSRDMEQKLTILQKIKMEKELSLGEKELEAQLLKDISSIGKHIRQEFEGINEIFF